MQWDATTNAGFGDGQPWLPLNPDYPQRNVAAQAADPDSLLNFYKQLLALRRESTALTRGELALLEDLPREVLGYRRTAENEEALVLLNFGGAEQSLHLPASAAGWQARLSNKQRAAERILPAAVPLSGSEALILTNR
jgi:glycosidase